MSDMKTKGIKIQLGNEEYGLRFTLNVIDDIQEKFDISISQFGELFTEEKKSIAIMRYLLTILINEDIDCVADETGEPPRKHVDERFVGRHIETKNLSEMMGPIFAAFSGSLPEKGDEVPNARSEE